MISSRAPAPGAAFALMLAACSAPSAAPTIEGPADAMTAAPEPPPAADASAPTGIVDWPAVEPFVAGLGAPFVSPSEIALRSEVRLEPGEERYHCVRVPWHRAGGIAVHRVTPSFGLGVHHGNVYWVPADAPAFNDATECPDHSAWHAVYISGTGSGQLDFPPGTALPIPAGSALVFDVHYVNASPATIVTGAGAQLHVLEPGARYEPVGAVTLGASTIEVPPRARAEARGTCRTHPPLRNVFLAFPHMHALGNEIDVTPQDTGVPLVYLPRWDVGNQQFVPVDPMANIAADVPLVTRCVYTNPTDATVRIGAGARDEMCTVTLYYWPAVQIPNDYCEDPPLPEGS